MHCSWLTNSRFWCANGADINMYVFQTVILILTLLSMILLYWMIIYVIFSMAFIIVLSFVSHDYTVKQQCILLRKYHIISPTGRALMSTGPAYQCLCDQDAQNNALSKVPCKWQMWFAHNGKGNYNDICKKMFNKCGLLSAGKCNMRLIFSNPCKWLLCGVSMLYVLLSAGIVTSSSKWQQLEQMYLILWMCVF